MTKTKAPKIKAHRVHAIADFDELQLLRQRLQQLADMHCDGKREGCDDDECLTCGVLFCPHAEPLHYHHDGCPACDALDLDERPPERT